MSVTAQKQNQFGSILVCLCIGFASCSKQSAENAPADGPNEKVEVATGRHISDAEMQIYEYVAAFGDQYTQRYGVDRGEALLFIATAKKFQKTVIEVCRAFFVVDRAKRNVEFTDTKTDEMTLLYLNGIGFRQLGTTWYYNGEVVNMGEPLRGE